MKTPNAVQHIGIYVRTIGRCDLSRTNWNQIQYWTSLRQKKEKLFNTMIKELRYVLYLVLVSATMSLQPKWLCTSINLSLFLCIHCSLCILTQDLIDFCFEKLIPPGEDRLKYFDFISQTELLNHPRPLSNLVFCLYLNYTILMFMITRNKFYHLQSIDDSDISL